MRFSIITLFPENFEPILNSSILKRAQQKGIVQYELINLREFGDGPHQIVDDRPYGGGVGLVFKADTLAKAWHSIDKKAGNYQTILTTASGQLYKQPMAKDLAKVEHIIIICGHYEGVDQRFIDQYVDLELSIGDFVLTGGELPAMLIIDSVTRLIPGVLEKAEAVQKESFENNLLEHPHYTRPAEFEGLTVPEVLVSGNHQEVEKWRQDQSQTRTRKNRPDLLDS